MKPSLCIEDAHGGKVVLDDHEQIQLLQQLKARFEQVPQYSPVSPFSPWYPTYPDETEGPPWTITFDGTGNCRKP